MQFNTSTDYAIRMILYLAKESITVSSSKLATFIGVSSRYLLQISAKLRDAGLIQAEKQGQFVRYSLKDERIRALMAVLKQAYCQEDYEGGAAGPPTELN